MIPVPDMAVLMSATGFMAHRKIVPNILSFASKHTLSQVINTCI